MNRHGALRGALCKGNIMDYRRYAVAILLAFGLLAGVARARTDHAVAHRFFRVELGTASTQPTSGRLLLFATNAKTAEAAAKAASDGKSSVVASVDADPFRATETSVAAREVSHWVPGQGVDIDTDRMAFPANWSTLPPGDYMVQAVLDVNHDYNSGGRGAGVLGSSDPYARLGADSARLRREGHHALSHGLLHAGFRRQQQSCDRTDLQRLRRDDEARDAADDLGVPGRVRPHRHQ